MSGALPVVVAVHARIVAQRGVDASRQCVSSTCVRCSSPPAQSHPWRPRRRVAVNSWRCASRSAVTRARSARPCSVSMAQAPTLLRVEPPRRRCPHVFDGQPVAKRRDDLAGEPLATALASRSAGRTAWTAPSDMFIRSPMTRTAHRSTELDHFGIAIAASAGHRRRAVGSSPLYLNHCITVTFVVQQTPLSACIRLYSHRIV